MYRDSCGQNRLVQGIFVVALLLLWGNPLLAQDTLALSSSSRTAAANGAATLNPSSTGSGPLIVIWRLAYPIANVVSIPASAGTADTAAGRRLSCYVTGGTAAGEVISPAVASLSRLQAILNNSCGSTCVRTPKNTNLTLSSPAPVRVSAAASSAATFSAMLTLRLQQQSVTNAGISRAAHFPVSSMPCKRVFELPAAELTAWQCYRLANQPS
jgi:hypothetical protein